MEGVLIKQLAIRLGYQKALHSHSAKSPKYSDISRWLTIDKSLVIVLPVWLVRQVQTYPLNVCFLVRMTATMQAELGEVLLLGSTRLRNRFESFEEAESWLIFQLEQLRQIHLFGIRAKKTSDEAAAKYLLDHQDKVSLIEDIYWLERLLPFS